MSPRAPLFLLAVALASSPLYACNKLAFHAVRLEPDAKDGATDSDDGAPGRDAGPSIACGYEGNRTSLVDLSSMAAIWRTDSLNADIVNMPGLSLTGWRTNAWVFVESDNVTLSDFYIGSTGATGGFFSIRTDARFGGAGLHVSNGTIEATDVTTMPEFGVFVEVDDVTLSDLDISGTLSGITVRGNNVSVEQVCIHDLHAVGTSSNGVYISKGSQIVLKNVQIGTSGSQVTPLSIVNDAGAIDDVLIENVRLTGGQYSIFVRGDGSATTVTNIRFRNVVIDEPGSVGVINYAGAPGAIVEWDVVDGNGNPIAAP